MNSALMLKIAAMHQFANRQPAQDASEPESMQEVEERHIRQIVNRNPRGVLAPSDGDHSPTAAERKISYHKKKSLSI